MSTQGTVAVLDRHSENYAAGVELGMLYQRLASEPLPVRTLIHAHNADLVGPLAAAFGATANVDEVDERWLSVTFVRSSDPLKR